MPAFRAFSEPLRKAVQNFFGKKPEKSLLSPTFRKSSENVIDFKGFSIFEIRKNHVPKVSENIIDLKGLFRISEVLNGEKWGFRKLLDPFPKRSVFCLDIWRVELQPGNKINEWRDRKNER